MPEMAEPLPTGLGEPEGNYAFIQMPGEVANSFSHLTRLVNEAKLHIDPEDNTLSTTHVDPANVGMCDITLKLDSDLGINRYQTTGNFTIGVNLSWLRQRLLFAKVGRGGLESGDTVNLLLSERKAKVQVDGDILRTSSIGTLPPETVRDEPEIPDLSLDAKAPDVASQDIKLATDAIVEESDHCKLSGLIEDGEGHLILYGQGDTTDETVRLPGAADATTPIDSKSSLFSLDYFKDMAKWLHQSKVDQLAINWADEYPMKMHFADSEYGIEGEYMLAPRIQSE